MPALYRREANNVNFQGYVGYNFRLHPIASPSDWAAEAGAGQRGGMIGFHSEAGNKRITFFDDVLNTDILVPRMDRNEIINGTYNFVPTVGGAPFAVNATETMVVHLNADLVDGAHASYSILPSTIALRNSAGRMKATTPVEPDDVANRQWVIDTVYGITTTKEECRALATGNVSIASAPAANNAIWDGVTLSNGDRIFLKNQTAGAENGIWIYNGAGAALTRAADADTSGEVNPGMTVFISEGTDWGNTRWQLITDDPIVLGTTALTFSQISGLSDLTATGGVKKVGNVISLDLAYSATWTAPHIWVPTVGGPGIVFRPPSETSLGGWAVQNAAGTRRCELLYVGTGAASLYGAGPGDTVQNVLAGNFVFSTADVARMTITNAGLVGIGTVPTSGKLHVVTTASEAIYAGNSGTGWSFEGHNTNAAGNRFVQLAGATYAAVFQNGNVGIGWSTPVSPLHVVGGGGTQSSTGTQTVRIFTTIGAGGTIVDALHLDCTPSTVYDQGVSLSFGLKDSSQGEYTSRLIHWGNSASTKASRFQIQTHSATTGVWNDGIVIDNVGNVSIGVAMGAISPRLLVKSSGTSNQDIQHWNTSAVRIAEMVSDASGHGRLLLRDSAGVMKVTIATSGSSVFHGGDIFVGPAGGAPLGVLHVQDGAAGTGTLTTHTTLVVENNGSAPSFHVIQARTSVGIVFAINNAGSLGFGENPNANYKLLIKEAATISAATLYTDTDGSSLANVGVARQASDLISGSATNDFVINNLSGAGSIIFGTANLKRLEIKNDGTVQLGGKAIARKFSTSSFGNGVLTSIDIAHNLGTLDVVVEVFDTTARDMVLLPWDHTDVNTIRLFFGTAPTLGQYTIVVIG